MYSNNTEILRTWFTIVWYSINGERYTGLDVTITPELEGMPTGLTGANEDSILQLPFLWQMSKPKWKKSLRKWIFILLQMKTVSLHLYLRANEACWTCHI